MKAILAVVYKLEFHFSNVPHSANHNIQAIFEAEVSIPALPAIGNEICLPVFSEPDQTGEVDHCEVTLVAFDLKNGVCIPRIYCEHVVMNGEEVFEAGYLQESERTREAYASARKDLENDITPRMKKQGFKRVQ